MNTAAVTLTWLLISVSATNANNGTSTVLARTVDRSACEFARTFIKEESVRTYCLPVQNYLSP